MPGIDLNLSLPTLADPMATVVAKVATALSLIEDDLAGLITVGELDMNAPLSLEGNPITDIGGLTLTTGASTVPGSVSYVGGEFYLVTPVGTVQVTSGGAINAASVGGITGMSGGASVAFDVPSGEFRFSKTVGVRADLVADDVVLTGAAGTVRLGVDAAITSARVINVKSLPTSGIGLLAYDAATSTLVDASAVTLTKDATFSGNVSFTGNLKHSDWTIPLFGRDAAYSTSQISGSSSYALVTNVATLAGEYGVIQIPIPIRNGERVKSVTVTVNNGTSATCTLTAEIRRVTYAGTTPTESTLGSTVTTTLGLQNVTVTVGAPSAQTGYMLHYLSLVMRNQAATTNQFLVWSGTAVVDAI